MKSIKLDFKSIIVGVLFAILLFLLFSFKAEDRAPDSQAGLFQAVASERGFIILNTQTGDYILDSEVNYIGKMTWIKGNFHSAHAAGVDKTKK